MRYIPTITKSSTSTLYQFFLFHPRDGAQKPGIHFYSLYQYQFHLFNHHFVLPTSKMHSICVPLSLGDSSKTLILYNTHGPLSLPKKEGIFQLSWNHSYITHLPLEIQKGLVKQIAEYSNLKQAITICLMSKGQKHGGVLYLNQFIPYVSISNG